MLACSLQSLKLSFAKAEKVVDALSCVWNGLHNDNTLNLLWESVVTEANSIGIEPPVLPRQCKILRRLDDSSSQSQHKDALVEDYHWRLYAYFAAVDAAIACLADRFRNPAFQIAHSIESLLTEAINTGADQAPAR
jgi:hypothetical protein